MKILVCIKQVPDMESHFRPNGSATWFDESDFAFRMNEYDEYAVEEAVRLKEQLGGAPEITVLSIGPDRVIEAIKKALAIGCDCAVHIKEPDVASKEPWQIASIIAAYARSKQFDLVFTGMQSQDRGSAQVGVLVAELLGIPSTTTLVGFAWADGVVTATRELEGGVKSKVRLKTPALVTCQLGLNSPRYPTLPNIMKARKKEITTLQAGELSSEKPLTGSAAFRHPEKRGSGVVLEGSVDELVEKVLVILKDKTAVLR